MHLLFRVVLLASLAAFLPAPLSAQIGLRGGVNLVELIGDDVESDRRMRLAGGASFDVLSLGPLTLSPELYYAQKGADDLRSTLQQGQPAQVSLEYVEIPLLVRLRLPFGGTRLSPYLVGGPVFGWRLDCSFETTDQEAGEDCDELFGGSQQVEETLRDHERGLAFGAGFAFDVLQGLGAVTLDARYTVGLTRLTETDEGMDVENRSLAVLLGYRLGG